MTYRLTLRPLSEAPELQEILGQGFYALLEGAPPWTVTATLTNQARLYVNGIKATIGIEFVVNDTVISWVGAYEIDGDVVEVYG